MLLLQIWLVSPWLHLDLCVLLMVWDSTRWQGSNMCSFCSLRIGCHNLVNSMPGHSLCKRTHCLFNLILRCPNGLLLWL